MNKIVLSLLAFFICFACFSQNNQQRGRNEQVCRTGFTYEISHSPHWGYGKPVVTSVQPYSVASQNGLQINDIIEYIDSVAVADIPFEELDARLNVEGKDETVLIISNLSIQGKRIFIKKDCKRAQSVTEDQLAAAFFLFSPETTGERFFRCPFNTSTTLEPIDFSRFRTFAFTVTDEGNSELELAINDCIEQELLKKRLDIDYITPDLLIQTYYFFDKNPDFRGRNLIEISKRLVFRYDIRQKRMVRLPFLDPSASETEAEYLLQLGFRLIDQKINPGRVVWECEANELLEDIYTLENYARLNIPLMCMQYPYVKHQANVVFRVDQKVYNYTGLCYDLNNPARITSIEANSPAASLGIRRGDQVVSIGGKPVPATWEDLSASYQEFVKETAHFRDPANRYAHPEYTIDAMYWDQEVYTEVTEAFSESRFDIPFAYLFAYAPYVQATGTDLCRFIIKRGNNEQEYIIRPSVRLEQTLSVGISR